MWHSGSRRTIASILAVSLVSVLMPNRAHALDGATPLEITPYNIPGTDWRLLELYTGGNDISAIADSGYTQKTLFDGIGAYAHDASTTRVVFNHEISGNASISYLDLNTPNLKNWIAANTATPASPVAQRIGTAYTSIVGSAALSRFCSSTLFEPNRFGPGNGFASRAYLTGEEVGGGSIYATDLDPASPTFRRMFECSPILPTGSWENIAQFDTGRTDKVGLVLLEDAGSSSAGTAPMRIWIGNKRDVNGNGSMDFLEANGLAEGQTYYWIPSGTGTAAPSRYTATGNSITGTWSTSNTGAMMFTKLEDGAVSPHSGSLVGFNCQDQGTFTMQLNIAFAGANLDTATSSATIALLLEEALDGGAATGFNNQDNLDWSTPNLLFTQEDGDNQEIWQLNPASGNANRDALAIARVTGGAGEASGIVDVSALLGYMPGSILLTDTLSGTLADNQLVLMVSPTAQLVPEPASVLLTLATSAALVRRRRCGVCAA
jgi:hypothetical protein